MPKGEKERGRKRNRGRRRGREREREEEEQREEERERKREREKEREKEREVRGERGGFRSKHTAALYLVPTRMKRPQLTVRGATKPPHLTDTRRTLNGLPTQRSHWNGNISPSGGGGCGIVALWRYSGVAV